MDQDKAGHISVAHDRLKDALIELQKGRPEDRSEEARRIAIIFTELEKAEAIFERWFPTHMY